ncbi:MAG: hypothetical protein KKA42_03730 [candidate division Zixibacteria bacterium]|nr:hypothetical protein [candidate division Zixibacteria bacterium]
MKTIFSVFSVVVLALILGCGGTTDVEELRRLGKEAFANQDYAGAREYLLKAIATHPSDKDLLYFTGVAYRRDYMFDSALFYLKRADILYPKDRELNLEIYEIAQALGQWDNAIASLYVIGETGDGLKKHYAKLSELWGKNEHPANAFYWMQKAMEENPDEPDYFMKAAHLAVICVSPDSAISILDSAMRAFGDKEVLLANKATYLVYKEDFVGAEKILRGLVAGDTAVAEFKLNLANVLSSQENRAKQTEALDLFRTIKDRVNPAFNLDSVITALEDKLQ